MGTQTYSAKVPSRGTPKIRASKLQTRSSLPQPIVVIDGLVQIQNGLEARLAPGQFVDVEILGSDEHDLYGEAMVAATA